MDMKLRTGAQGLLSWILAVLGAVLLFFFVFYGRFHPTAGIWFAGGFCLLLAFSLLRGGSSGGETREIRASLDNIMREDCLDLCAAEQREDPLQSGLACQVGRFVGIIRKYLLPIAKNLQQFAFHFFSLERQLNRFFNAFFFMTEQITGGLASSKKVSDAMAEQLASSEEIAATAQNLARVASEVNTSMLSVSEGAKKGNIRLAEMEQVFKSAEKNTRQLEKEADDLSEKANSIRSTVRVISGIADQTNLLALNASIEAARAGEAGRGFAVVADEVKELADESKTAAKQIFSGLEDLIDGVHEAAKSIKSMSSFMKEVDATVQEVLTEIGGVLSGISKVSDASGRVASSAQELGASSEELAGSAQVVVEEAGNMRSLLSDVGREVTALRSVVESVRETTQDGSREAMDLIAELREIKMMTPSDFASAMEGAIRAHQDWVTRLKKTLQTGMMECETDSRRCRFGVFLSSVERPDAVSRDTWDNMLVMHERLHSLGHKVEDSLLEKDMKRAGDFCREAEGLSKELIALLGQIILICGRQENALAVR